MSSGSDPDHEDEYDIRDAGDLTPFSPPECLDCGACCHSDYVHVWVSGSDHARLTPEERDRLTFFDGTLCYMRMTDGHCAALVLEDAQWKCSVYERRPFLCREFARGGSACRHEAETRGVQTRAALAEARLLPRADVASASPAPSGTLGDSSAADEARSRLASRLPAASEPPGVPFPAPAKP